MTETFANELATFFQDKIPNELIIFLISLLPILELRGGMIAAKLLQVDFLRAFVICYIGNILPIPFILLFIRKIFQFLRDKKGFSKLIEKLEIRSMRKSEKVKRWRDWGLLLFVAIPLPGTGAWTGALVAALLGRRLSHAMLSIGAGVMTACCIVALLCKGIIHIAGL